MYLFFLIICLNCKKHNFMTTGIYQNNLSVYKLWVNVFKTTLDRNNRLHWKTNLKLFYTYIG